MMAGEAGALKAKPLRGGLRPALTAPASPALRTSGRDEETARQPNQETDKRAGGDRQKAKRTLRKSVRKVSEHLSGRSPVQTTRPAMTQICVAGPININAVR